MTASAIITLILGGGLAATVVCMLNATTSLRAARIERERSMPDPRAYRDATPTATLEDVRARVALEEEIGPDYEAFHFRELVHLAGETTGHWLPGHQEECRRCQLDMRAASEARVLKIREELSKVRHFPMAGSGFETDEEQIIEWTASGEIAVMYAYALAVHDPGACQTCHDAGASEIMPRESVKLSTIGDLAGGLKLTAPSEKPVYPAMALPF